MYKKLSVFIAACMGMAFFGITMTSLGSVMPQISQTFGLNQIEMSELIVFLPIGILFGSLFFGPIVDRWGYKYLLIISSLFVVLGLEGMAMLQNLAWMRIAILSIGFGGGILNGLTNALVSDITDDKDRGAKLSLLGAFYGLGALGIPVLLAFLSKHYPYQTVMQYIGFFILLCVVYFFVIGFPKAKQSQGFPLIAGAKLLKQPLLLILSFVLFFQAAVEGLGNNWTTTYLGRVGNLSGEQALFAFTFLMIGLTAARLLLSVLFRKIGERRLLFGSILIALTGCAVLMFVPTYLGASIAMTLIGFGLAATFPVVFGMLGSAYASLSGTVFSIALVIALLGNTSVNYLMGIVAEQWGIGLYPVLMMISLCAMILLFTLSLRAGKKNR
ncbi:MAG: MFS transporter [Bacteroidales bacterium]|nr:MFS transporter [Bacteroidales bacterium]